jgi:di/tricarboxylate transporter
MLVLMALAVSYFYLHYTFASLTAQTTALYPGFLAAALSAGVPPCWRRCRWPISPA